MVTAILMLIACWSCNNQNTAQQEQEKDTKFVAGSTSGLNLLSDAHDLLRITGDFNGDGRVDTLQESFEPIPGEEQGVGNCAVVSPTNKLPPIATAGRCTGLLFLHNEGDLTKDGADEVSLVREWHTGFSREVEIYTLQNGQWKELDVFSINISFLIGHNPKYNYEELVIPAVSEPGYTVLEYNPVNPDQMWQRHLGKGVER